MSNWAWFCGGTRTLFSSRPTPFGVFRATPVRASQPQNQVGYFYLAALVAGNNNSQVAEEQFGPALLIVKYRRPVRPAAPGP